MRLGWHIGHWATVPENFARRVQEAERLGYDSLFTAEAWGSDALTSLAWCAALTERIQLGTSIVQLSARTPTATAMGAATLDALSGGRMTLGVGVSGPQVVEGWYGQPFDKPLARTREYVSIIRAVLERRGPVTNAGPHYPIPLRSEGLGKPLATILHPVRNDMPVFLGAQGPKNIALAAEIADGWLPVFFSTDLDTFYREALEQGHTRPGARRQPNDFEIWPTIPLVMDDDIETAADKLRPLIALYVGGMGARAANFHVDTYIRLGFEAEANEIQEHYLAGRRNDAIATVTTPMVEATCIIGPPAKIRERFQELDRSLATGVLVGGPMEIPLETLRVLPDLL